MRIAMWSGPRNLSTAMMYAFGNRPDFAVWDEPFYAPYLVATGAQHPMRDEIIAVHETDPQKVAAACLGSIPAEKPHFYMKHMPHHMVDGFPLDWAKDCVNVHLIRHPARVIASYAKKHPQMTAWDIGFPQQKHIYETLGGVIIDSADILRDPEATLSALCKAIGLPFDKRMLSWPSGGRPEDGVWAAHWYDGVHKSTGFGGPDGPVPSVPPELEPLLAEVLPIYDQMAARALQP